MSHLNLAPFCAKEQLKNKKRATMTVKKDAKCLRHFVMKLFVLWNVLKLSNYDTSFVIFHCIVKRDSIIAFPLGVIFPQAFVLPCLV